MPDNKKQNKLSEAIRTIMAYGGKLENQDNSQMPQGMMNEPGSEMPNGKSGGNPSNMGIRPGGANPNQVASYQGKTHESGGIPIGNNTEVEDGEFKYEDMIFSNRVESSDGNTFAKQAKSIYKKYGKRLEVSDGKAKKSADRELKSLFDQQELVKKQVYGDAMNEMNGQDNGRNKLFIGAAINTGMQIAGGISGAIDKKKNAQRSDEQYDRNKLKFSAGVNSQTVNSINDNARATADVENLGQQSAFSQALGVASPIVGAASSLIGEGGENGAIANGDSNEILANGGRMKYALGGNNDPSLTGDEALEIHQGFVDQGIFTDVPTEQSAKEQQYGNWARKNKSMMSKQSKPSLISGDYMVNSQVSGASSYNKEFGDRWINDYNASKGRDGFTTADPYQIPKRDASPIPPETPPTELAYGGRTKMYSGGPPMRNDPPYQGNQTYEQAMIPSYLQDNSTRFNSSGFGFEQSPSGIGYNKPQVEGFDPINNTYGGGIKQSSRASTYAGNQGGSVVPNTNQVYTNNGAPPDMLQSDLDPAFMSSADNQFNSLDQSNFANPDAQDYGNRINQSETNIDDVDKDQVNGSSGFKKSWDESGLTGLDVAKYGLTGLNSILDSNATSKPVGNQAYLQGLMQDGPDVRNAEAYNQIESQNRASQDALMNSGNLGAGSLRSNLQANNINALRAKSGVASNDLNINESEDLRREYANQSIMAQNQQERSRVDNADRADLSAYEDQRRTNINNTNQNFLGILNDVQNRGSVEKMAGYDYGVSGRFKDYKYDPKTGKKIN